MCEVKSAAILKFIELKYSVQEQFYKFYFMLFYFIGGSGSRLLNSNLPLFGDTF